jgi:hypothetical protein
MLRSVVDQHMTKLERVAIAAKSSRDFNIDQARADDRRAHWTYRLLDAQGSGAVVRSQDRTQMTLEGLSEPDIEAVKNHLKMLRDNNLVPTKPHILERLLNGVQGQPTAMNFAHMNRGGSFEGSRGGMSEGADATNQRFRCALMCRNERCTFQLS